jgi:MFS family permease
VLRPLAIMLGIQNMAFAAVFSVFVLYAVIPGPMGLTEAGFGVLLATLGVGSLLGTWLAVPAERRLGRVPTLVLSVVLNGASVAVYAVTASPVLVGISFAVSGVTMVLWNVVTVSLRQRITPDRLLGRMNAAYRLVGWGTMPIGAFLGGALAEWLGLRPTFLVAAVLTLLTLIGFRYVTREAVARADAAGAPTG